jgi:hypothetical protein
MNLFIGARSIPFLGSFSQPERIGPRFSPITSISRLGQTSSGHSLAVFLLLN